MLNQFGLDVDSDGNCIVDGIVTLKEGRTLSDINIEEMSVSHLFKNKYHCRLPVCKFYLLLKNPNISYFEISKPIFKL